MYINFHTHHQRESDNSTLSVFNAEITSGLPAPYCSAGIHPWRLKNADQELDQLRELANEKNLVAIGECGLDNLCDSDPGLQAHFFSQQILLANQVQKPLIIHCVRAFDKVLSLLRAASVPAVFHGFSKKQELALSITAKGYYLSFGKNILNPESAATKSLAALSEDRFFLETDDEQVDISLLYAAAARIRNTSEEAIILQLQKNFDNIIRQ